MNVSAALAAEPAVRAAERAIVTESSTVVADTLAVSTAVESRRRLARVLELKDRADSDPDHRDAFHRAAEDYRNWAAGVYLAATGDQQVRFAPPPARRAGTTRAPVVKHKNPYTEESMSLRRLIPRPPVAGQPRRRPAHRPQPEQQEQSG
jgi:hypothetical protein